MGQDELELFQKALSLPEKQRADLAARLLESLDEQADEDVEEAWKAEVQRRLGEIDSDKVDMIPWREVRQQLFDRLNDHQAS